MYVLYIERDESAGQFHPSVGEVLLLFPVQKVA